MWELDYKESWVLNNWCFWNVVLEKILESPLDCKEIKESILKEISLKLKKAETSKLQPPDVKNWLIGKDPDSGKDGRQEEKGMTNDKMVGWHHWLDGYEFEQALGIGDRQGSVLQSMGCKESDTTEQLNWTGVSLSQGFATCRCNVITWEMCYLHTHLLNICLTCTWVSGTLLSAGDTTAR